MLIRRTLRCTLALLFLAGLGIPTTLAQDPVDGPPFSLPFADPPGPNSWFYEQHYGNSTAAFNFGSVWYDSGQGLHFGVDLEAPCGTPVLAIANGVVAYVDGPGFGAEPHNLVLNHPDSGYASLYGHLAETPRLVRGQEVRRGEQIGISGDPDGSCESRPHLHLEIRSIDYQVAHNPLPFFDVNWHMLTSIGLYNNHFQQDLDAPYRWMRLEDQPDIHFSGPILNRYLHPWPIPLERRAPVNPPADRHLAPLPRDVRITVAPVAHDQWNLGAWWQPPDLDAVYLIDAVPGQDAGIFRQPLDGSPRQYVGHAPPAVLSPNGDVEVRSLGGDMMMVQRLSDGAAWDVWTGGNYPAVSPGSSYLLWEVLYGQVLPGQDGPPLEIWVSNLDGSQARKVYTQIGGWSLWLDDHRLVIVKPTTYSADTQLFILDVEAEEPTPALLGTYRFLRGLSVAPGGEWIVYWLYFQDNPADSGIYVQRTRPNSTPRKLDFFGAYRWRDDRSLYTLSFDLTQDAHALGYIDVVEGVHRTLTDPDDLPIRIANGDWSVSPDGTQIVFVDPLDYGLYRLTIDGE